MSVVQLEQVSRRYGEVVALDGIDTTIGRGEVVALLGPNGAGKSTLFEVLLGLVQPSVGRARIFGRTPGSDIRHRIGAMLQNAGLMDQVTVFELVRLIGRSYPAALSADAALMRVGLTGARDRTVGVLSGGERQRLLLAIAVVGDPELLVLDEPTAAMDVDARNDFWEQARTSVGRGVTLLFATHDLAEADAFADRVLVLHRGRLIADARPSELKQRVSGCVVSLVTNARPEEISLWPGVDRVEPSAAGDRTSEPPHRLLIWAADAESVVVPLVRAGHHLSGLSVDEASLEDAFAQLTSASVSPSPPAPATPGAMS